MKLFGHMKSFFEETGLLFSSFDEDEIISMGGGGENGQWFIMARVIHNSSVVIYSICAAKAKENKRQMMAEFLTRANCGLVIGNFEFVMEDGRISYKTSAHIMDENLPSEYIKTSIASLLSINVSTFDRYLPGIMSVLYGNLSPETAIKSIDEESGEEKEEEKEEVMAGLEDLLLDILRKGE